MAKLLYQGHASFRLTTDSGKVIYIDPFAGEGYDLPADLVLVTHQHYDHNRVDLMPHAEGCVVYQNTDALKNGEYRSADIAGVHIEATEAYNRNHPKEECVGYLISADGKLLYFAGDTAQTEQMSTLSKRGIDYAFLPIDGIYTMTPEEAVICAEIIKAKINVPIHMAPGELFDPRRTALFLAPDVMVMLPGTEYEL